MHCIKKNSVQDNNMYTGIGKRRRTLRKGRALANVFERLERIEHIIEKSHGPMG